MNQRNDNIRVLLIGKFPPIQGGIASRTYWLAKGLQNRGIDFAVVSDGPEAIEQEYCINGCEDNNSLGNVTTHYLRGSTPWHIPNSPLNGERLYSLGLQVAGSFEPHIIESNYLFPYGWAAHLLAIRLGLPHLVRHGGSDIYKLRQVPELDRLAEEILSGASLIVTSEGFGGGVENYPHCAKIHPYAAHPAFAQRAVQNQGENLRILYLGKVNYYWRQKKLDALLELTLEQKDFEICLYAQGRGLSEFSNLVREKHAENCFKFHSFVAPRHVPEILSSSDAVFVCDESANVPSTSNVVFEAVAAGKPVICNSKVWKFAAKFGLTEHCIDFDSGGLSVVEAVKAYAASGLQIPKEKIEEQYLLWVQRNLDLYMQVGRPL